MSKRLIYVPFWEKELEALIIFLKEHQYDEVEIGHLETLAANLHKKD